MKYGTTIANYECGGLESTAVAYLIVLLRHLPVAAEESHERLNDDSRYASVIRTEYLRRRSIKGRIRDAVPSLNWSLSVGCLVEPP